MGYEPHEHEETIKQRRSLAEEGASRLDHMYPDAHCALDFSTAFELLVATVLSAQTTDKRVNLVTPELFHRWPDAEQMSEASVEELEKVVKPLGMFRRRASHLSGLSLQLSEKYRGIVPDNREELEELPGVGRKTANVVLGNWFGQQEITVDTHVGRVTRRLEWTEETNPVKVEKDLWALLPHAPWTKLCHQLIFHGRQICHSRKPECGACRLADICPSVMD